MTVDANVLEADVVAAPPAAAAAAEAPFSIEELFFSRTDERGIILASNSVFQRVSMYGWEELSRKPHKIIRHPDMPKAVFWLLWETIKQGQPIGAYVKNRAKDGRHYWVFAIVTPIDGGYLSVRLKPTSAFLAAIEKEYLALGARERQERLAPADSAALLLTRLGELGFDNYEAFMSRALSSEIAARDASLGRPHDRSLTRFDELTAAAQSLQAQAGEVFDAYAESRLVPLNLRVQAIQLGQEGRSIGAISESYSVVSAEIKAGMDRLMVATEEVWGTIKRGLFLTCTVRAQREMVEIFREEAAEGDASHEQEMALLEDQQASYHQKAGEGLREIAAQVARFQETCTDMKRLAAGLEVTRIMGKVEGARLRVANAELAKLIDDLERFQSALVAGLKKIDQTNLAIHLNVRRLLGAS